MRIKIFRIILFTFCIGFILISCGKSSKEVFRIDSLNDSCWQSSLWISVANAPVVKEKVYDGTRAADGTSWFMSTVKNDKKVSRALWMTTGLGVYEIYVNGKLVGDEILKPGFTHYEKTKLSFTYDVTGCFKTASGDENVLSAQVTPGWWADKIITPGGHDGMIGKKCAFRGVLELTYTDGSKELYGTNIEDWKAGIAGPVTHAAIFDGEEYDARIPLGYETPEKLSTPEVNNEFKGEIFPSDGAEVYFRQDLSLAPVNAYIWESVEGKNENDFGKIVIKRKYNAGEPMEINPGENLVIDFGQNTAAVPSFIFSAAEGTVLNCVTSELLNDGNGAKDRGMDGPEGSVHRLNLRIPDTGMKLKYIFADSEGDVNYTPRCTFFGYRFISINVSDKVVIKDIKSLPVTSISKEMEIGCIKTGNELVNKLISNTLWGQRSNYLSIPTDCPQRNERLGWTADTQVFAETGSFFANTSSFFHKWMRDLIDSQGETGGFPGVAPLSQYGNDMTRLGWSDAGVIVPWTIWKQFGDKEIVELSWDAMEKYMSHINETRYDHNTLIGENGNYQWAEPKQDHSLLILHLFSING
jgi:alpha-L-rhamnosidase